MSNAGYSTGLGDWLFRQAAFPEAEDNTEEYLDAYYPEQVEGFREIRAAVGQVRPRLGEFIDRAIGEHGLAGADLVGLTSIFSQTTPSLAMAGSLKELNPEVTTVMGGPACTGEAGMEFARCCGAIDAVFSGPALVSFPKFVECWSAGDREGCERIDGVFTPGNLTTEGAAVAGFGRERNINKVIPLDYDSFLDHFEGAFGGSGLEPRLLFETSRGCWWGEKSHCSFCGLNGPFMCYHSMSPEQAVAQIHAILRYSDRCKFFASTDNIIPENFVEEVLPQLKVPEDVGIQYEVRPNLGEKQLAVFAKARVKVIQPGIEALSSDTLRLMGKGSSAFSNIRFLKACSKHAIFAGYSLLICSPGESEETYERYLEIIPSLTHLPPPLAVYPIEFVRYSPYFENAGEHGLELAPDPYYAFTFPLPEESIGRIANRFRDRNADPARMQEWLGRLGESVGYWQARWYSRDGREQARLCLVEDEDGAVVFDSRDGEEKELRLEGDELRVLDMLEMPVRPEVLAGKLPGIDTGAVLGRMLECDLLFEEGGRWMSLVVR
jgi:magnesium-protoporphyrin IX monomethyl ester (oxidative) cyclase